MPTLCRITGAPADSALFDGGDVLYVLRGVRRPTERGIYLGDSSVITRTWKLVGDSLFAIERDPEEVRDVASEHPEVVARLRAVARAAEARGNL